jgi:hypothetical protein
MATRTLILFATEEDGFKEWEKLGSAVNEYEEIKKEGSEELEAGPNKPSTATGLKSKTKSAKAEFELPVINLALHGAGEQIKSGAVHCYGKVNVAKAFEYGVIGGITEDVSFFLSTTTGWEKQTLEPAVIKGLQEAAELKERSPLILTCLKGSDGCEVNSLYLELVIEYTSAHVLTASLTPSISSLNRALQHQFIASVMPNGMLMKNPARLLQASLSSSVTFGTISTLVRAFTASLAQTGSLAKSFTFTKVFIPSFTPTVTLKRALIRALTPSLKPGVMLDRATGHQLDAAMQPTAATRRLVVRALLASLTSKVAAGYAARKQLAAALASSASLESRGSFAGIVRVLKASLTFDGEAKKLITRLSEFATFVRTLRSPADVTQSRPSATVKQK